jgi:hypothetical protein
MELFYFSSVAHPFVRAFKFLQESDCLWTSSTGLLNVTSSHVSVVRMNKIDILPNGACAGAAYCFCSTRLGLIPIDLSREAHRSIRLACDPLVQLPNDNA